MTEVDEPDLAPAPFALIRRRYEPVDVLGRGGQGEVVRAIDRQHNREVALKIRPVFDEGKRQALLAEARILLTLRPHPNLPLVREDFFWSDHYVLAMDFVAGTDLRRVLDESGEPGLPLGSVVGWLEQAAEAIGHLHAQGIVHGDVKPANLVLTPDGRIVLVDFGIARRADEPDPGGERQPGTPGYAAPELHDGPITPAADIYGLAATAVALLTGSPPSVGRPDWQGVAHAADIERALRRGLAIDPARRPRTAAELIGRLRSCLTADLPGGIVTLLLTDIEGSTARWEANPAGMAELVTAHDAAVADAVDGHDGRLLTTRGDGDATLSVFVRASDAVAAAVAAQRALAAMGAPVRMAIHTGEAEVGEGDYAGRTVERVARLRSVARAGQIVLSGATADLAGYALPAGTSLADLEVGSRRDLAPGERVCCIVDADLVATAHPEPVIVPAAGTPSRLPPSSTRLPHALTLGSTTFVGRAADLDRLLRVWRQARLGDRRVVLVGGEPGIGKTHLAATLARRVLDDGGAVLYGTCDEGLQVPYQPFATALGQAVDDAIDSGGLPLLGRHPEELGRLVPWLADRAPQLLAPPARDTVTADADQHRMFDGVADWLRSITGVAPLLLVLDDLHWATRPTLRLLRHVVGALDPAPVLVLGLYRDTEAGRRRSLDELLADLYRMPDVERLTLGGLSAGDVVDLLEAATGRPLAPSARAVARAIRAETGGNPFFARQFLRHLIDNGTLVTDEQARWTVVEVTEPLGVPEGVREVMVRRLGRLSDDALRALEVAAVVGNEFDLDILTSALAADEDVVLTGLEEAIDARLLTEVAPFRFRFAHILVRSSIVDGVAQDRCGRLHRTVAQTIEAIHGDRLDEHLTELAHHYAASTDAGDADRAMGYAVRAGRAAADRLAHEEAAASFRMAVELGDRPDRQPFEDDAEHARLRVLLGQAQLRAGDPAYRDTFIVAGRLAADAGDADVAAAAALANRGLVPGLVRRSDAERLGQLETAIDLVSGREGPELCRLLAQLGYELKSAGDRTRRFALSERALTMARRVGDPASLADVLLLRIETIAHPDTIEERLRLVDEALEVLEGEPEPSSTARALVLGVDAGLEAGGIDRVDEFLDRAVRLADEVGDPAVAWLVQLAQVKRLSLAGAHDEAARTADAAVALGEAAGQADAPLVLAIQRLVTGAYRHLPDRLLPDRPAAGGPVDDPALLVLRGWALGRAGRVAECGDLLAMAVDRGLGWLPDDENRLTLAALVAGSAERVGDAAAAELARAELEPYGGRVVADRIAVWGSVAHFIGLADAALGRLDAAEARLVEAIDLHRRLAAPVLVAASQAALARVVAERGWKGDRPRLARLVEEVAATADEFGLDALRSELAALGVT